MAEPTATDFIRFPRTCISRHSDKTYVRLLNYVSESHQDGMVFYGNFYAAGSKIPREKLGDRAVVLECAGPERNSGRGHRRALYRHILWRYDFQANTWVEVASVSSVGSEWTACLRPIAIELLNCQPESIEFHLRGRDVAEEIIEQVDTRLRVEIEPVRKSALRVVSDRLNGKLACA